MKTEELITALKDFISEEFKQELANPMNKPKDLWEKGVLEDHFGTTENEEIKNFVIKNDEILVILYKYSRVFLVYPYNEKHAKLTAIKYGQVREETGWWTHNWVWKYYVDQTKHWCGDNTIESDNTYNYDLIKTTTLKYTFKVIAMDFEDNVKVERWEYNPEKFTNEYKTYYIRKYMGSSSYIDKLLYITRHPLVEKLYTMGYRGWASFLSRGLELDVTIKNYWGSDGITENKLVKSKNIYKDLHIPKPIFKFIDEYFVYTFYKRGYVTNECPEKFRDIELSTSRFTTPGSSIIWNALISLYWILGYNVNVYGDEHRYDGFESIFDKDDETLICALQIIARCREFRDRYGNNQIAFNKVIFPNPSSYDIKRIAKIISVRENATAYSDAISIIRTYAKAEIAQLWDARGAQRNASDTLPDEYNIILTPKDIRSAYDINRWHDILVEGKLKIQELRDEKRAEERRKMFADYFKKTLPEYIKRYEYSDNDFCIKVPSDVNDLVKEGRSLGHCVGGYTDDHFKGNTTILFLRKASSPETSFFTIEVRNGEIKQIHGNGNRWLGTAPEAIQFVVNWINKIGTRCSKHIISNLSTGYSSSNRHADLTNITGLGENFY